MQFEINVENESFENLLNNYHSCAVSVLPSNFNKYEMIDFEKLSLQLDTSLYCVCGTVIKIESLNKNNISFCISLKPFPCHNLSSHPINIFHFLMKGKSYDFIRKINKESAIFLYNFKVEPLPYPGVYIQSEISYVFVSEISPQVTHIGLVDRREKVISKNTLGKNMVEHYHQNSYIKLSEVVSGVIGKYVDVYGVIVLVKSPIKTSQGEYSMTIIIRDDSLETNSSGLMCNLFSKRYDLLPIMAKTDCIIHAKGLKTQSYQGKMQCMSNRGYSWIIYEKNKSNYQIMASSINYITNETIDQEYLSNLYKSYINSIQDQDEEKYITFEKITTTLSSGSSGSSGSSVSSFSIAALVLGFFTFKHYKKSVIVVTDGTKCPYSTLPSNLSFSDASTSYISYPFMELHKNTCNYIIVEEDKFNITSNISPLIFLQITNLTLNESENGANTHLEIELTTKLQTSQSVVILSNACEIVFNIRSRLCMNEEPPSVHLIHWTSLTLPGLSVVNTTALEDNISEHQYLQPPPLPSSQSPQPSQSSNHYFHIQLSDKYINTPIVSFQSLIDGPSYDDLSVHKISARIVGIWPGSFSEGLTGYCDSCSVLFISKKINKKNDIVCEGCCKLLKTRVRFLIVLNHNKDYIPVILSQERALNFFNVKCKLEELTSHIVDEIDNKYVQFFNYFSPSLQITEENNYFYNLCLISRKVSNLGINNDHSVTVYEIIGANIT